MRAVKEVQEQMKLRQAAGTSGAAATPVERVMSWPARSRQFLHDVRLEMRNVTWPNWKDVQSTTIVVLITTFFFGFYLGTALDVPFAQLIHWLLKVGRRLVG